MRTSTPTLPIIDSVFASGSDLGFIGSGDTASDQTPTLTGMAAAHSFVDIFVNGVQVDSVVADEQGHWAYAPHLVEGENVITAVVDNQSSEPFVVNFVPPLDTRPTIAQAYDDEYLHGVIAEGGSTQDKTPTFFGTAQPHAEVVLFSQGNEVGRAHADGNGDWSITPTLSNGEHFLSVLSQGQFSEMFALNVEGSADSRPVISSFYSEGEAGHVSNGADTDDRALQLAGTATPHSIVHIFVNGLPVHSVMADEGGHWQFGAYLEEGENVVTAVVNNVSSDPFVINFLPLNEARPAIVHAYDDEHLHGMIAEGGSTQDTTPTFFGTAQPYAEVVLFSQGSEVGRAHADGNGDWSITPTLSSGEHFLSVRSQGQVSEMFALNVEGSADSRPVISSVFDNEGEMGYVGNGGTTDDRTPQVAGTAAPHAVVHIFVNGLLAHSVVADEFGNWEGTPYLGEGESVLTAVVGDLSSEPFVITVGSPVDIRPTITDAYDDEGHPALLLSGDVTDDKAPTFFGKASPHAEVVLYSDNREVGRTQADANGNWSVTSASLQNGQHILSVVSGGQASEPFILHVEAVVNSRPLILSAYDNVGETGYIQYGGVTDDNTPTLTGKALPDAYVQFYANGRDVGGTYADANGDWVYTPTLQNGINMLNAASGDMFSAEFVLEVQAGLSGQSSLTDNSLLAGGDFVLFAQGDVLSDEPDQQQWENFEASLLNPVDEYAVFEGGEVVLSQSSCAYALLSEEILSQQAA